MCGCNASASIVGCHLGRTRTITTTRVEPHSWGQRASYWSCRIWSRPSLISTSQPFLPSAVQRLHVPNFFIEIQNKSYLVYMLQAHWRHCEVIKHGVADLRNHLNPKVEQTQKTKHRRRHIKSGCKSTEWPWYFVLWAAWFSRLSQFYCRLLTASALLVATNII